LRGFSKYPIVQTRRQELISTLRIFLQQAESLRLTREESNLNACDVAIANEKLGRVVAISVETRSLNTGHKQWREYRSKTVPHGITAPFGGKRTTHYLAEYAEYLVETREKHTRGDGEVSYTDWFEKGREWRETGILDSNH
jgi:hypothetical protein